MKHDQLDKIIAIMDLLYKINTCGDIVDFKVNQEFVDVFGKQDESLLLDQKCIRFCDIDVILENVILTQNHTYSILDYEWVFDCTIPVSFIMYRAILHSIALSKLNEEEIEKIYLRYGITEELKTLYLSMEENFQHYVSDEKISDYYNKSRMYLLDLHKEVEKDLLDIIVNGQKNTLFNSKQMHYETNVENQDVNIEFGKKSILKLNSIKMNGNLISVFKTNAFFVINDDYYFIETPKISVPNQESGLLEIDFFMYYYGEDCIDNIINLIDANHRLNQELSEIKESKIYRLTKNKI